MNNLKTGVTEIAPPPVVSKKDSIIEKIKGKLPLDKIPQPIKDAFSKFYSQKLIFWPVTIVFGMLFLVIVLGLLFGNKGTPPPPTPRATPTPFVQSTPEPCNETSTLCVTANKLRDLNTQINSLDLKQSRLTPPQINYEISF